MIFQTLLRSRDWIEKLVMEFKKCILATITFVEFSQIFLHLN